MCFVCSEQGQLLPFTSLYYILIGLEVILCPDVIIYVVSRNHVTFVVSFSFSHIVAFV